MSVPILRMLPQLLLPECQSFSWTGPSGQVQLGLWYVRLPRPPQVLTQERDSAVLGDEQTHRGDGSGAPPPVSLLLKAWLWQSDSLVSGGAQGAVLFQAGGSGRLGGYC